MILRSCSMPTTSPKFSSDGRYHCKSSDNYKFHFHYRVLEKYYVGELIDNEMPTYAVDK